MKENQQAVLVTGAAATVDGHMTSTKPDKPAQEQAEKKQEDAQQHLDSVTEETSESQTPQKGWCSNCLMFVQSGLV